MALQLDIRSLIYKSLNPIAASTGFKMLIVDNGMHNEIQKRLHSFGVSKSAYDELDDALDYNRCVVLLKSSKYYGPGEVAQVFSKFGLNEDDVHYIRTQNADKDENYPWGSFSKNIPHGKEMHLCWFAVDVIEH